MDQTGPVGVGDVIFPGERENIRSAFRRTLLSWTTADEELALRLYTSMTGWTADQAVEAAMNLAEGFLARAKEERRGR